MSLFLPPLAAGPKSSSVLSPKILSDWLVAISAFQNSFHQLNQYRLATLNDTLEGLALRQRSQCRATQLLERMCQELNALGREVDCVSDLTSLARHTARLQSLTNQATIVLGLVHQSNG